MNTEPELLNERLERLAMVLDEIMPNCALLVRDALELLKAQQETIEGTIKETKDEWPDETLPVSRNKEREYPYDHSRRNKA